MAPSCRHQPPCTSTHLDALSVQRTPQEEKGTTNSAESSAASLLHDLLTQNWSMLRTLRVCPEPGVPKRDGSTMVDVVSRKVKAIAALAPEELEKLDEVEKTAWCA